MSKETRLDIIKKIEKIRDSKVITYIVSDRPRVNVSIEEEDLREIYEHIKRVPNNKKIDLFLYSLGGDATVGWALANLIREHSQKFDVLVPFKCFSCATSISLGADRIVMHKAGILGPIDPFVANDFNPKIDNIIRPISVEDVAGYLSLIKDKFDIKDQEHVAQGFNALSSTVNPLALGNVYRHYLKSRDDAKKLLELHLNTKTDKERIEKIIDILVEKLYYHGHHINRKEAKLIGLDVDFAEEFKDDKDNLSDLMWLLLNEYEKDLKLRIPYRDELPINGLVNKLPIKIIESVSLTSTKVLEQTFVDLGFSDTARLVIVNDRPAIYNSLPNSQPEIIPLLFEGQPVNIENKIYDKKELAYWENQI